MFEKDIISYDDLELLYVSCLQNSIANALEKQTQNAPEYKDGGWWAVLKKWDDDNTKKKNKENKDAGNKKHVSNVTMSANSVKDLDLQACNKIIVHLEKARNSIFTYYNVDPNERDRCVRLCEELIAFRNKYYHKTPEVTDKERKKKYVDAIMSMDAVIGIAFSKVLDENGESYHANFSKLRIKYELEINKTQYFVFDYLDAEKYDADKFYAACVEIGITNYGKEDGRMYFYSSNLNRDLELLKNKMIVVADGKKATAATSVVKEVIVPAVSAPVLNTPVASTPVNTNVQSQGSKVKKTFAIIGAVIAIVIISVLLTIILVNNSEENGGEDRENYSVYQGGVQTTAEPIINDNGDDSVVPDENLTDRGSVVAPTEIPTNAPESTDNSVYQKYKTEIKNLQLADDLTRQLYTKIVKVGDETTVLNSVTSQWKDTELLSATPDIVEVTEDRFIRGISEGEGYIIFDTNTGVQVFLIIVKR